MSVRFVAMLTMMFDEGSFFRYSCFSCFRTLMKPKSFGVISVYKSLCNMLSDICSHKTMNPQRLAPKRLFTLFSIFFRVLLSRSSRIMMTELTFSILGSFTGPLISVKRSKALCNALYLILLIKFMLQI